jgi:glyoxylase-like metal-dependent hydrolase (beta-lactamase superfamily II)
MAPHDGGIAALSFPHDQAPGSGLTTLVAPGVHWVRMRLPFALDHINLWLIEDGPGWTIVDTGIASEETKAAWEQVFAETLGGRKVTRVIVTHFHPDHMGLAGWLCPRWQAPLWVTETEWLFGRTMSSDRDDAGFAEEQRPFYARTGIDPAMAEGFFERGNPYWRRVTPVPRAFHRIADGQEITIGGRAWRVVVGRGHAPEHACLWCPELDVFIAGDQILPKISPNVGVWPTEPEGNPLALYLASLRKIRDIVPASVLVLPSHNLPFRGLDTRIDQLLEHHRDRLAEVEAACAEPRNAAEIVPVLFRRKLDLHQLGFALGETLSHIHLLLGERRLRRWLGEDGVYRYERAAS